MTSSEVFSLETLAQGAGLCSEELGFRRPISDALLLRTFETSGLDFCIVNDCVLFKTAGLDVTGVLSPASLLGEETLRVDVPVGAELVAETGSFVLSDVTRGSGFF